MHDRSNPFNKGYGSPKKVKPIETENTSTESLIAQRKHYKAKYEEYRSKYESLASECEHLRNTVATYNKRLVKAYDEAREDSYKIIEQRDSTIRRLNEKIKKLNVKINDNQNIKTINYLMGKSQKLEDENIELKKRVLSYSLKYGSNERGKVSGMRFEKVSFKAFRESWMGATNEEVEQIYKGLKMPRRATKGSAGYDFFSPIDFELRPCDSIVFPTGIRAKMPEGWVLMIFPRSGQGFKYRLQLDNTVGIIDSDYYYSDNEGNIGMKLTCDSKDPGCVVKVKKGQAIAQGVFVKYGLTSNDKTRKTRNGGFGSTDEK